MRTTRTPDPAVTDRDAAELVAFLDGGLPSGRRAAVAARVIADPALAAALDRRRTAVAAIGAAISVTSAPPALHRRVGGLMGEDARCIHRIPGAGSPL
jgi:anti-sigma factor RsiW